MGLVPCLCLCAEFQERELFDDLQKTRSLKGWQSRPAGAHRISVSLPLSNSTEGKVQAGHVCVLENVWPRWVAHSMVFLAISSVLFLYLLKCHFWQKHMGEILYVEEKEIVFPLPPSQIHNEKYEQ